MTGPKKVWLETKGKRMEVTPEDDTGEPNVDTLNYAHMAVKEGRFAQTGTCLTTVLGWFAVVLLCLLLVVVLRVMNGGWDSLLQMLGWK